MIVILGVAFGVPLVGTVADSDYAALVITYVVRHLEFGYFGRFAGVPGFVRVGGLRVLFLYRLYAFVFFGVGLFRVYLLEFALY